MLTFPAEGLIVPTNATSNSQANPLAPAKAMPVAIIKADAPISSERWEPGRASRPMASVRSEEPSSAAVAMNPTSKWTEPEFSQIDNEKDGYEAVTEIPQCAGCVKAGRGTRTRRPRAGSRDIRTEVPCYGFWDVISQM